MSLLQPLPPLLKRQFECVMQRFPASTLSHENGIAAAFSDFICEALLRYPTEWQQCALPMPQPQEWLHYADWLDKALSSVSDEETLMRQLRLFRRQMLMRIACMQVTCQSTTEETLRQLSELADVLIIRTRDWLYQRCCAELGTPCDAKGRPQPLLILAMGKLGGGELNFSSDVDLIFTYPQNGHTRGGGRQQDNALFFTRLGQRLINVLAQPTAHGIVYRVDMRLRPFGDSGPLVMSFAALEDYYQEQGRDWERYAMIKARLLGEQTRWQEELYGMLHPFVFRRYIDFGVIQSLREMKKLITREVRRRGLTENIKLGAGGIREAEFIVQALQLIRGGREPSLQCRAFLPALQAIAALTLLPDEQCTQLRDAYLFLRRLENLLQSLNDQQTQTLPENELDRQRLAWAMNAGDWPSLLAVLDGHRAAVHTIFMQLVGEASPQMSDGEQMTDYALFWQSPTPENVPDMLACPAALASDLCNVVANFRQEMGKRTIGPRGRQLLDVLIPCLLSDVCPQPDALTTLMRLCPLLLNIVTRTTYLELLTEYPAALSQLISLCAASSLVAEQLARYPLLLDELLDPAALYQPMALSAYRDELRQYLLRLPQNDEEQQLEAMRQFRQVHHLRIAAADIAQTLPLMKVSDHLTWLAEAIIDAVVQQAWNTLTARYGAPEHLSVDERGIAVIGYGKLGGWELSYRSDLDLVFLHNCPPDSQTRGPQRIDSRYFYLRLAQRILHLFSIRTAGGVLYEVDTRLRPSGAAGLLVSTFDAYAFYQQHEAWTWEHQALVRARAVYGEASLRCRFDAIRHAILTRARDPVRLKKDVREMREKMRSHHTAKHHNGWDIKSDSGGITDIEFIAQYLVLRYSAQNEALAQWTDNVRIFELMSRYKVMSVQEADTLTADWICLRNRLHELALQTQPGRLSSEAFADVRERVQAAWQRWLAE